LNHCYEIIPFDNGSSIDIKDGRSEIDKDLYFIISGDSISLCNVSRQIISDKIEISKEGIGINSSIRTESAIFGTVERALNLNVMSHKINLWNRDADGAYSNGMDPLYINVPFYIDYTKDFFYGIMYNNSPKVLLILARIKFIMNFQKEVVTSFS